MNINPINQFQAYNRYMPQTNGITWVQGIEGAKAYQLVPNSNAILMDSDNDGIFYIKVSDNVGMCNLRTFNYTEITNSTTNTPSNNVDLSNYVTRDELSQLIQSLKEESPNVKSTISGTSKEPKPLITK